MSADEAEPETDVSLTDPEAVVSMALHLVLWAVVLVAAVARTRLWFSDQALLREMFFGGATADGHLTERPYIRLLMRPFDFLLFCGVTILCWAPVYLAGEPSLAMRHLRTLLLPIGLTALAGGQIAKTVVSLKLVENEWKVRTKEMSRASAVNSSKSVARALMICVTVVTALSLAVVAAWTPTLLQRDSPVMPPGWLWTALTIQLPILATGLRGAGVLRPSFCTSEVMRARSLSSFTRRKMSVRQQRTARASAAIQHVARVLGWCNVVAVVGCGLVLAAILHSSRAVGGRAAYATSCGLNLAGTALLWGAVLRTIELMHESEHFLLEDMEGQEKEHHERRHAHMGFEQLSQLMHRTSSINMTGHDAHGNRRSLLGFGHSMWGGARGATKVVVAVQALEPPPAMGRAPPAPPASLSRAPSFKTPSERVTSIALQTAAVAEVALPVPPPLPAPAPDETKEGGGAEAQRAGVAMHAGAVVRAALASSPSQALEAEAFMARLRQCAASMRRPEYSLKDFHADMEACFPELRLYLVAKHGTGGEGGVAMSGRSSEDEYKRTIGALFAVYWLMRLNLPEVHGSGDLDGQRGWAFGAVEEATWAPPSQGLMRELREALKASKAPPPVSSQASPLLPMRMLSGQADKAAEKKSRPLDAASARAEKQLDFVDHLEWGELHQLLVDAQLLQADGDGGVTIGVERTMAMLALTAIHDIMKVEALLPSVLPQHAPYRGFAAGERITDHDVALGYVLEHDPEALPGFARLPEAQRQPIRFTQAKLGFNHGWLVQAEAPPGALFSSFKALLDQGGASSADIAFYFTHWLTDLAGAVPAPLSGCQQFVARFPRPVLAAFMRSFPLVQRLSLLNETQLNEEFLLAWWPKQSLGPPPAGDDAVALLRLVVHCQTPADRSLVVEAWGELPAEPKQILSDEMARTGVAGQRYASRVGANKTAPADFAPALLVYYGPAYLRSSLHDEPVGALHILAEVYRAGRALFPASSDDPAKEDGGVTLHIGQLKAAATAKNIVEAYGKGSCWLLVKTGETEAVVESCAMAELATRLQPPCRAEVLQLWPAAVPLEAHAAGHAEGPGERLPRSSV